MQCYLSLLLVLLVGRVSCQCNSLPGGESCENQDGLKFSDPEDCSSYYQCEADCAKHIKCEKDYLFDTKYGYCNYPTVVDCMDRPCDDSGHCKTTPTRTSTTTTPDCGHVLECKDLGQEGYFPDPYNCRKYWHCYAGRSEHVLCEDGMYFDELNVWCDFPDRVDCGNRPICDECDNNCVQPPSPTPDCGHILNCTDLDDGWYIDEYNCRKYWHCLGGRGVHYTCDDGLLYDEENIWCNFPDKVDCKSRPVCDECDEHCQVPTTPPPPCDHVMDCSGKPDGWYADSYNCRKYWHCENGMGEHFMCKNDMLYDPVHIWCDYPNRVNCGNRPICDKCDENCSF